MKEIAVILVNFNSSEYTLQCVDSILLQTDPAMDYSIVVVDNKSRQEEIEKLKRLEDSDRIRVIRCPENNGFSAANVTGMNSIHARSYYFLNNDTVLMNDAISILFHFMEEKQDAGIASGQMYHADGSRGVNFNYFPDLRLKFLGSGLLRIVFPREYPKKNIQYTEPLKVPVLNGSSLFIRKTALEKAGGFDTMFFLYCEEEDIALRMKDIDYYCYLVPEAGYIHFEGKSSMNDGGINLPMLREFYISQHYLYLKHYGRTSSYIWRISQFFRSLRKFYIHRDYVKLAMFILIHPRRRYSLRHTGQSD